MNRRLPLMGVLLLIQACSGPEPGLGTRAAPLGTGIRFLVDNGNGEFARVLEPRPFEFPADHGSHPEYRSEWWYFTGNLTDAAQRHYGFEVTFFRLGLRPAQPDGESAWRSSHIWMAHFALTDTDNEGFFSAERLSRGALDTAGARASPFRVWVEDWSVSASETGFDAGLSLRAAMAEAEVDLFLRPAKAPVGQGNNGFDPKGPEPGNASYYYSLPRLAVRGSVRAGDGPAQAVEGLAWMDREWGTSALSPGVEGWDWFALQLDDGRDLMLYRLRTAGGGSSPFSSGSLIDAEGAVATLAADDFLLTPRRYWTSSSSGVRYPVAWEVSIPDRGIRLEVEPYIEQQEIDLSVRYWEGAVKIEGSAAGAAVAGRGYLELAGY